MDYIGNAFTLMLATIMRTLVIILGVILLNNLEVSAQEINKELFVNNSHWFTDNYKESFYSADTVKLINIAEINSSRDDVQSKFIELHHNDLKDITQIDFRKSGLAEISNVSSENWRGSESDGQWTWKLKSKKRILQLFLNDKLNTEFQIISIKDEKNITIWGVKDGYESEMQFTILILKRIK